MNKAAEALIRRARVKNELMELAAEYVAHNTQRNSVGTGGHSKVSPFIHPQVVVLVRRETT